MTAFKAILLSSFPHSRLSILINGVSSLSKLFSTSHPKSIISKESLMAQEDRARLREFLHGKCKSGIHCFLGRPGGCRATGGRTIIFATSGVE
ncbi:hypothetical protein ACOSQ3_004032 [Xanthoceras sorbifolium]